MNTPSYQTITSNNYYGAATPLPGDIICAVVQTRSWVDENYRGQDGIKIWVNDIALVIQVWASGNQVRIRALMNDQIVILSSAHKSIRWQWRIISRNNTSHDGTIRVMDPVYG